jgi:Toprim-like/Protein of unknown function (DUF3991)
MCERGEKMFSKEEIERIKRETSLPELAASYGYAMDEKASCRTSLVMRHHGNKIIVATGEDRHGIFFDVHGSASGSVIDFVMWQEGVNFGKACQTLSERITAPRLSLRTPARTFATPPPITRDRAGVVLAWERMKPYKPGYLEERGLHPRTLARFAGCIRTDERNNACFLHQDDNGISGYEVKNKGFTGFAGGGTKALFTCRVGEQAGDPLMIAIAEIAIDIMSYYQLHPADGLYVSIGGAMSPEQQAQLAALLTRHPQAVVIIATDKDKDGEKYADFIRTVRPDADRAEPPIGKDWNDSLMQRQAVLAR